jgi:cytidyltransferase-like protein
MIGVTSGCFDILHPLHIVFLNKCLRECDLLYVLVDSDELVYKRKGKLPVFNERDRIFMLEQLNQVDHAFIMNTKEHFENMAKDLGAKKMFKNKTLIDNAPTWEIKGIETIIISDVNVFSSSTDIKNFLKV